MSTGCQCEIVEVGPGQWWLVLEDYVGSRDADWRDNASAYGPFESLADAEEELERSHANPGGHLVYRYDGDDDMPDERMVEMMAAARERDGDLTGSGPFPSRR